MGTTQRTRRKFLRHPFFLQLLQAFCIFEPVSSEATSQASRLAKGPGVEAAGCRKQPASEATAKPDIGGVI